MNKDYYKEYYYLEREHWWFKARSKIIETHATQLIEGIANPKILNVGVATGATSDMLKKLGEVTSLEYDKDCCQFLREQLNFDVIQGSVTELPFPDKIFDLVCAFDVIEHIEDDSLALQEMVRVCKPGGRIMVTVPAFMSLWSEHDEINHHFRRYTTSTLKQLFEQSDKGKINYISYFNSILFLPIYLARKISNVFTSKNNEKKLKSDFSKFNTGILNNLLYNVFLTENSLLKKRKSFPAGVSILLSWIKNK